MWSLPCWFQEGNFLNWDYKSVPHLSLGKLHFKVDCRRVFEPWEGDLGSRSWSKCLGT